MLNRRQGWAQVWYVIFASVTILTGVQLILPVLPVMQQDLGLSDSQISLVTSAYFFPSILLAFPIGLLADRIGRRRVYVASLTIFGLCGVALLFSRSFTTVLIVRVLQGAAYAAVHPLSIAMIGDIRSGIEQVGAQGQRAAVMAMGGAALPIIGGFMAGFAWFAPFSLQLAAIPLAVAGWFLIRPVSLSEQQPAAIYLRQLVRVLQDRSSLALQLSGFLRFIFKFAFLTYLPILLVSKRGISPTFAGIALGGASVSGTIIAATAGRIVRVTVPSRLIALSLIVIGGSFVAVALDESALLALGVSFAFGAADEVYGVLQNALVAQVPPANLRAAFTAATGSIRNLGKFLAPSILGLSVLVLPLEASFVLMGVLAIVALVTVPLLSQHDNRLIQGEVDLDSSAQPVDSS